MGAPQDGRNPTRGMQAEPLGGFATFAMTAKLDARKVFLSPPRCRSRAQTRPQWSETFCRTGIDGRRNHLARIGGRRRLRRPHYAFALSVEALWVSSTY
jgi:hypothetical protein